MSEITTEDINRVHKRLDEMVEEQTRSRIAIGRIEKTLELMPTPPLRPCPQHIELKEEFNEHIESHEEIQKEKRQLWQRPFVTMLIHLIELGIVAIVTWLFVR